MAKTPMVWMEARCGSVTGGGGDNWELPDWCHQTSECGGFFGSITDAKKHHLKYKWEIIDGDWWCPECVKILKN